MMKHVVRIGCGAGFSGDRLEPAAILVEHGKLDYLVLECLAERTIALAQKRKLVDSTMGYDPLLERRMEMLLPLLKKHGVKLLTNMGAANPVAAADKMLEIAKRLSIPIKIAAVTGDDVLAMISGEELAIETGKPLVQSGAILSANAYLGAEAILPALQSGADIIVTGRVADPSLFVAPLAHDLGWSLDDWEMMGKATVYGHLMECAGQITGGYYADPVKKPVNGMDILGHPFVNVYRDGFATIGKVEGTGGLINLATAKEQLLYEVTNPYEYVTPDVVADFTSVLLTQEAENVVRVTGGGGKQKPYSFKTSIGYKAGFNGEGEISYAGEQALARAQMAGEIIRSRLQDRFADLRIDFIGCTSVHPASFGQDCQPHEIRLRVAGRAQTSEDAALIGEEVEALYTNGPAGGGGVRKYINEVIGIVSTLVDRSNIKSHVTIREV